jgi:hypothetical protein
LDNGADGQDIKQFGLQLLALIEENLVTDNEQGITDNRLAYDDIFDKLPEMLRHLKER